MAIKQQRWPLILTLVASSASAADAPIQSVTLYPGSATVERVVQVSPGMTQVEITGLLANFETSTVRLQADPGIQVGQVVTRDQGQADNPSPRAAELEAKIQALEDQVAQIDAEAKAAQTVQAYLERLGGTDNAAGRPAPVDPKALAGTLDAIRKGASEALLRVHAGEVKKRSLAKQLEVLQRDLAKAQAATRESRTMTVAVAAKQAGRIVLSYQVNRAGWKPAYRASLDSNASKVEIERMATISQKTGEDWSRVKLRLSTGQPNLSVNAPDPSPWLLTWEPSLQRLAELSNARSVRPAPPAPPAPAQRQRVAVTGSAIADDYIAPVLETQGSFTTEFEVPARVDLASDGREISVALSQQALPVKQSVRIAPRYYGNLAVLTVDAPRPEGVWLPGQVQLRRDGAYVGALHWNPQDSERFSMAFGRDPLVRVVVENRNEASGEKGLFVRDNERRIADSYVVTNLHKQPIDVLVLEPTPVSQSEQVQVKVALNPQPTLTDWQARGGLVGWERRLTPNETARFDMDYTIGYPREGSVSGLR